MAKRRLLLSPFILQPALLHFQNVSVRRGDRLAVTNLNLRVETDEHLAILGPNGSGKSTLLKLLTRECYPLLRPDSFLRILGEERWNLFDLRSKLGIVTNDLMAQCTRDITGRELVLSGFFGSIGLPPNQRVTDQQEGIAVSSMKRVGAEMLGDRWVDELSSGEARRLLLARALIHQPQTLLLDEPTTSLDLAAQRDFRERLQQLAVEGTSLLLVTHHLEEIVPEIQRIVLLRQGMIVGDGPKAEVLTSACMSELFGAPVQVWENDGIYRAW